MLQHAKLHLQGQRTHTSAWQTCQVGHRGLCESVLHTTDTRPGCAGGVSIGKFIVPYPHVRQVLVPEEGCRVILGTDGLWDFVAASRAFSLADRLAPAAAAAALCKQAPVAQVCAQACLY